MPDPRSCLFVDRHGHRHPRRRCRVDGHRPRPGEPDGGSSRRPDSDKPSGPFQPLPLHGPIPWF
ncbi:hypothetical protein EKH55_3666 [Sinorhizobium alkalisoli]|nr:hypothetical protein EKH55_3666 [Sinorhizobium alkalisoli]